MCMYCLLGWQPSGYVMVAILKKTALSNYVIVHSSIIGPSFVNAGYERQMKSTLSTASAIVHYYKHKKKAKNARSWEDQTFDLNFKICKTLLW